MKEYIITAQDEGLTLLKYSFRILESAPQSIIRKFLRNKNIELNSRRADGSERLKSGDSVKFYLADDTFDKFSEKLQDSHKDKDRSIKLDRNWIIYEDDDYIFINKPAGIMSQSDASGRTSLNDMLLSYVPSGPAFRPSICNRLDTNTSGIVICGRTIKGLQNMDSAIKDRRIGKFYRCLCHGTFANDMQLEAYLKKDAGRNRVEITDTPQKGADLIITRIHVLENLKDAAYLEIELITGKSHQIRAHLAHIGHPLLGDMKYGRREKDIGRQMLHAYRLKLPDDILDGREIKAPLPEDFRTVLNSLKA